MKDVFLRVFPEVSKFSYSEYHRDFACRAPLWILHSAGLAHEDVRMFSGFQSLHAFLEEHSFTCWNNPELYPHLYRALRAGNERSDSIQSLKALEAHLGLRDVSADLFTHRYFRRNRPFPATFELIDGQVREVPDAIIGTDRSFPLIYSPVPHLFDDVVGGRVSYDGSPLPVAPESICGEVYKAGELLHRYDATLYNGFTEAIGTLAVTGGWNLTDRISYSTGSHYTGGIFASLCPDNSTLLVESHYPRVLPPAPMALVDHRSADRLAGPGCLIDLAS